MSMPESLNYSDEPPHTDVKPLWYSILIIILCVSLYTTPVIKITKKVTSITIVRKLFNIIYLILLTVVGYAIVAVCFIPFIVGYLLLLVAKKIVEGVIYLKFGNTVSHAPDMDIMWNSTSENLLPFINIAVHYEGELNNQPDLQMMKKTLTENVLEYHSSTGQRSFRKFTQIFQPYYGYFMWKDCEQFNIDNHIHSFDLSELYPNVDDKKCDNKNLKSTEQLLCRYISEFGAKPLPTWMPQWQMIKLTKGKNTKDFFIVLQLHHAIGDGMCLVRLFLEHLLDKPLKISLLGPQPSKFVRYLTSLWSIAFIPFALRHIFLKGTTNPLHGKPLTGKKIVVTSDDISLEEVRRIKRVTRASVTDVLFCCLSYAMDAHFERRNHETSAIDICFPVGFEDKSAPIKLSNTFAMGIATLPISIKDEGDELVSTPGLKRLYKTKRYFDFVKNTPDTLALYYFAKMLLQVLPFKFAKLLYNSKGITIGVSNVPGPQELISSYNCPSKALRFWIPDQTPNGCGVTFVSYCNKIRMGFSVDETFDTSREELELIIDDFGKALNQLTSETL